MSFFKVKKGTTNCISKVSLSLDQWQVVADNGSNPSGGEPTLKEEVRGAS